MRTLGWQEASPCTQEEQAELKERIGPARIEGARCPLIRRSGALSRAGSGAAQL